MVLPRKRSTAFASGAPSKGQKPASSGNTAAHFWHVLATGGSVTPTSDGDRPPEGAEPARDPERDVEDGDDHDRVLHDLADAAVAGGAEVPMTEDRRERLEGERADGERDQRTERVVREDAVEVAVE